MRNPEHVLRTRMTVQPPLEEAFEFFAAAENLARITPPDMRFRMVTPSPIRMSEGVLIDYRLSVFGVGFGWQTEITTWKPPFEFVDTQVRGPYAQWVHRHRFTATSAGTLIEDEVRYRLPVPIFGELAAPLVRLQLRRIFRFREQSIRALLEQPMKDRQRQPAEERQATATDHASGAAAGHG